MICVISMLKEQSFTGSTLAQGRPTSGQCCANIVLFGIQDVTTFVPSLISFFIVYLIYNLRINIFKCVIYTAAVFEKN